MTLARKGVILNPREWCCAFWFREEEDINHLFFNCTFSLQVWKKIYRWLNVRISYKLGLGSFSLFALLFERKFWPFFNLYSDENVQFCNISIVS
jgi:hypothetical protein